MAATKLLATNAKPDEGAIRTAMSGNLCRCGTYPKIISAIQAVARGEFRLAEAAAAPPDGGSASARDANAP